MYADYGLSRRSIGAFITVWFLGFTVSAGVRLRPDPAAAEFRLWLWVRTHRRTVQLGITGGWPRVRWYHDRHAAPRWAT